MSTGSSPKSPISPNTSWSNGAASGAKISNLNPQLASCFFPNHAGQPAAAQAEHKEVTAHDNIEKIEVKITTPAMSRCARIGTPLSPIKESKYNTV